MSRYTRFRSKLGAVSPVWIGLSATVILGIVTFFWIARLMDGIMFPGPTEAHRVQLERDLLRDFGVRMSVRSVVHIDLDRSGRVAWLEEDKVETVVSLIDRTNLSQGEVERLDKNLFRAGKRFYRFENYKANVLLISCSYREKLDDLLDYAQSRGLLDEAYRKT